MVVYMANKEHIKILNHGMKIWNQWRMQNSEVGPDLSNADLHSADLRFFDFNLTSFRNANLAFADLRSADFSGANLTDAILTGANLTNANLSFATLDNANLTNARVGLTHFDSLDLRSTKGLDKIKHVMASFIDTRTIIYSQGQITEVFLRGCGIPEPFIENIHSLANAEKPIQYHSVFISHSQHDHRLAERIHNDLQARGVRCWLASHDLKIGDRYQPHRRSHPHL